MQLEVRATSRTGLELFFASFRYYRTAGFKKTQLGTRTRDYYSFYKKLKLAEVLSNPDHRRLRRTQVRRRLLEVHLPKELLVHGQSVFQESRPWQESRAVVIYVTKQLLPSLSLVTSDSGFFHYEILSCTCPEQNKLGSGWWTVDY